MRCFSRAEPAGSDLAYTFLFDTDFKVPQVLLEGTRAEVQSYLSQFHRLLEVERAHIQKETHGDIYKSVEAQLRTERDRLYEVERTKAARLAEECQVLRARLEEIGRGVRADEEAIRMQAERTWRERLAEMREESNKMNTYMSQQLEAVRAELRAAHERLMVRDGQLKKSQGRGQVGELEFAAVASSAAGWTLERISGQARECDFKMNYYGLDVRFEVKNHLATNIPAEDIKKFRRDMEEHRDTAAVGVLVALNVHVSHNKGRIFSTEWKEDTGQLLIYVSAFYEQDPEFVFLYLKSVLDVYLRYRNLYNERLLGCEELGTATQLEGLKARVDSATIHAQVMGGHLRELRLKLMRDKKTMTKMFDDTTELLKSALSEYELSLGLLLGNDGIGPTAGAEASTPTGDAVMVSIDEGSAAEVVAATPKKRTRRTKTPTTTAT